MTGPGRRTPTAAASPTIPLRVTAAESRSFPELKVLVAPPARRHITFPHMPFLSRRGARTDEPELPYDARSPEGLAARWVRWVAAAGPLKNPVGDETGEYAALNQPDDVWFLAGTSGERMERTCTVPAGRDMFLPVFNYWNRNAAGPPEVPDRATGSLTVDGASLTPDPIGTPVPFMVTGARLNGVTLRKKPVPVTVWGLWKLVPALPPGEHQLHAVGSDGYGFTVDITYRLLVSRAPTPTYPIR
jgi:hypothetical protein